MKPAFDRSALPYWDARAQRWKVSQPISPGPEDQRFYEACAARRVPEDGSELTALLLGVTPAIAQMRWPGPTRLVALDWSGGMFRNVWPREHLPRGAAGVRGDWRAMPLADGSVDFAIGDGCYSTFRDLEGPALLNREVHRVLRPGGEFCLRCHRRPDVPHSIERLFEWLHAGRFQNLDLFRWILAMAVHGDSIEGVSLHRVWETWREHVPDAKALAARFGWTDADQCARTALLRARALRPSRLRVGRAVSPVAHAARGLSPHRKASIPAASRSRLALTEGSFAKASGAPGVRLASRR